MLENKRLMTCAELLRDAGSCGERRAADIGADHGYLACYLVKSGICKTAVAADINPLPLQSARRTVAEQGLEGQVDCLLSDGLDSIPPEGVTEIICAGMGGELIADIIARCGWARGCTLILQPMTKADRLRRWLYDNGFFVEEERACRDGKFVYAVMRVRFAPEKLDYPCDERYLTAGRVSAGYAEGEEYIAAAAARLLKAAEGMAGSRSDDGKIKDEASRLAALGKRLLQECGGKI